GGGANVCGCVACACDCGCAGVCGCGCADVDGVCAGASIVCDTGAVPSTAGDGAEPREALASGAGRALIAGGTIGFVRRPTRMPAKAATVTIAAVTAQRARGRRPGSTTVGGTATGTSRSSCAC